MAQLALDLPTPRQPRPRRCPERAAFERRAAARAALFHPADPACATLAQHLFCDRADLSAISETLRGSAAARRWLRKLVARGIVREWRCHWSGNKRWRATRFA